MIPTFFITLIAFLSLTPLYAEQVDSRHLIFSEIPIMSGLNITEFFGGNPDDVDVRVVEAEASGSLVAEDIYEYYEDHLQKLKWQTVKGRRGVFERGDERLVIKVRNFDDDLIIVFILKT